MKRIKSLDILRGVAATSIMIFHYFKDALPYSLNAEHVLSRLGFYGVSVFYILSGLTLSFVYQNKLDSIKDTYFFYKKRIFRIYPLMIACTIITLMYNSTYTWYSIFMNLTGLFGLFDYNNYIGLGVWSIGNELVFYLFFPIIMYTLINNKKVFYSWVLISFFALILNSFYLVEINNPSNWEHYINPMNQFIYFFAGIIIGQLKPLKQRHSITVISIAILIFIFYPLKGDADLLIASFHRIVFSACCLLIVYGFSSINLSKFEFSVFTKFLIIIGEISYGIYLLHPIVYEGINHIIIMIGYSYLSSTYKIPIMIVVTLVLSFLSYHYFELPISRKCKMKSIENENINC